MSTQVKQPQTLMEALRYFADPQVCHDFVENLRWPEGVRCVYCDSKEIGFIKSRRKYQCKGCRKQFSVRHNTIFEDSKISLDKWLGVMWMIANCRNGVSSYEVARSIGVTQKTGWFMLQRIRLAMQAESFVKLDGEVEVDETLIGGKARFMHADKRAKFGKKGKNRKTGSFNKIVVLGLLERDGEVRTKVIQNIRRKILDPEVREHIESGATVYTDALPSYESLGDEYIHKTIDHAERYAMGQTHTNNMENYWSLLKRALKGTYISCEPFHLFRYLDEQAYRFNNRKATDAERFAGVVAGVTGRRLTYKKLTGEAQTI